MVKSFEKQFIAFIATQMQQDLAHDLNHVYRVVNTAKALCLSEGGMVEVVLPAAYLHDCFSFAKNIPTVLKAHVMRQIKPSHFYRVLIIQLNFYLPFTMR